MANTQVYNFYIGLVDGSAWEHLEAATFEQMEACKASWNIPMPGDEGIGVEWEIL